MAHQIIAYTKCKAMWLLGMKKCSQIPQRRTQCRVSPWDIGRGRNWGQDGGMEDGSCNGIGKGYRLEVDRERIWIWGGLKVDGVGVYEG